ncbi:MAG: C45 family autoproteolytic acyltransferase/hydrolase [Dehalococcoidia bacterium]
MAVATAADVQPRREDHGALIVLHLSGTYREMGRQHVELLRPLARQAYELQLADWKRLVSGIGPAARLADLFLPPLWAWLWRRFEPSRAYDFMVGMGDALRVSGPNAVRGFYGFLGSGTTTFVATGSATADGRAIIGKNSDWSDAGGLRRPIVTHYHPSNGDLSHIAAGWPLLPGSGTTGVNEAGFAIGANFFNADQIVGLPLPRWPYFRALQKATTVEEGIRILTDSPNRGLASFASMADAHGAIAMVEYTPGQCAVFRPDDEWFAQANHARTDEMAPHDRGRSPDSYERRAAMEAAVQRHLGEITPQIAANILRDRSTSPYLNAPGVVANTGVLNSAVVHPASRTLWHSTSQQPQAPFGEMLPFTAGDSAAAPLPADPRLGAPQMEHEAHLVAELRRAARLFSEARVEEAGRIWDGLADGGEPLLQPHRLSWARARVRWTLGRWDEAEALLATLDTDDTPFDVRAHALLALGWTADHAGRREEAIESYRRALASLDTHPEYNHQFTIAPARAWASAGLKSPRIGPPPETPDLLRVP